MAKLSFIFEITFFLKKEKKLLFAHSCLQYTQIRTSFTEAVKDNLMFFPRFYCEGISTIK